MGKQKYLATYGNSIYAKNNYEAVHITVNSCPLPRLLPFIKSIDIRQQYIVRDTLCDGMYHKIKQLLHPLAKFYLSHTRYQLFQGQ